MFHSIVVPLDLDVIGDRALPVARSLAGLGCLPIELLTITSPRMVGLQDAFELDRRVKTYEIGPHSIQVLYDDDAGRAITSYLDAHEDALLVMASTAKGPIGERLFGSVSEYVLGHARRPVLVVGPHVDPSGRDGPPTLVACIDDPDDVEAAVPVIADWHQTFGGKPVRLVEVVPLAVGVGTTGEVAAPAVDYDDLARRLAERGVDSEWRALRGGDPTTRLEDFALDFTNVVFVAMSSRWTTSTPQWHSTTRALARRSRWPVLVVPAT